MRVFFTVSMTLSTRWCFVYIIYILIRGKCPSQFPLNCCIEEDTIKQKLSSLTSSYSATLFVSFGWYHCYIKSAYYWRNNDNLSFNNTSNVNDSKYKVTVRLIRALKSHRQHVPITTPRNVSMSFILEILHKKDIPVHKNKL